MSASSGSLDANRSAPSDDVPTIHIASWRVAVATELAIRSLHRHATAPFRLRVGHSGTDRESEEMLRSLEASSWLSLDVVEGTRHHGLWLDHWVRTCPTRYAVFVDSDVEFLKRGAPSTLVEALRRSGAAMQTCAIEPAVVNKNRMTGEDIHRAPRAAPYVLALDLQQVRRLDASFFHETVPGDPPTLYDTGARFYEAALAAGLRCEAMPERYLRTFRHYRNVSWAGNVRSSRRILIRHKLVVPYIRARAALLRRIQRSPSACVRPCLPASTTPA